MWMIFGRMRPAQIPEQKGESASFPWTARRAARPRGRTNGMVRRGPGTRIDRCDAKAGAIYSETDAERITRRDADFERQRRVIRMRASIFPICRQSSRLFDRRLTDHFSK
ncbi:MULTISPECIES: hypothetical protein [Caballeronia]|jgi:hypothetical protein|uniref:hypothetical protein n=1 Tax=Caballeronia TaxID=1827195 RepID=UPI0012682E3D|nr:MULTISPECIES: hypothetical protein [Caballeronia]